MSTSDQERSTETAGGATIDDERDPSPAVEREAGDPPCADRPLPARIEALLVTTDRALGEARLGALLGFSARGASKLIREAIDELNAAYADSGRAFRVERLAGGWQILTLPEFGPLLAAVQRERQQSRLSPSALETLSIIAYRGRQGGGVLRAEIEAIRGVSCGEVLRSLLERRLIKIVGRAEELGRPMLYGTTREFLKVFGLSSLDDLPEVEGLAGAPRAAGTSASKGAPAKGEPAREDAE